MSGQSRTEGRGCGSPGGLGTTTLPTMSSPGARDTEAARRLHRELNAPRGRARPRDEAEQGVAVKEEAEAEEVKVRAVEWWPV